jgi:LacI family transcriptional regulator
LKQKKIQLKDIAQEVGVSMATVSYVLNNQPMADRISKSVANKIRETAKTLNYQPNHIAKSLKTQKTNTIGLIVADIANPFSAQIARIIEDAAKKQGYTVIFGSSDENIGKAQGLIDAMLNRQVDGLIIAAVDKSEVQLQGIVDTGVPLVLIDRYFPNTPFSYVAVDNFAATFEAVQLLVQNGRKRIGLIANQSGLFHLTERNRGYFEAIKQAGLTTPNIYTHYISLKNIRQDVEQGLLKMLSAPQSIDAVLFTTNVLALNGLRYLRQKAVAVPQEVAVAVFDESEIYDFFPVSITHIRQPLESLGQKAVEILLGQINGSENNVLSILETELIVGQSSG